MLTRDAVLRVLHDERRRSPAGFIPWTPRALRTLRIAAERYQSLAAPDALVAALLDEEGDAAVVDRKAPTYLPCSAKRRGGAACCDSGSEEDWNRKPV